MNKKVTLLLFSIIAFILIYLSFALRINEENDIKRNGKEVIGMITHHGLKTISISYSFAGKHYTLTKEIPFATLVEGEQYYVTIHKEKPEKGLINMSKPFTDTLQFKWSTTNAVNVKRLWVNRKQVEFYYKVNGTEYRRLQQDNNAGSNRNGFKNEKVKYRTDQPEIGYLLSASE